MILVALGANLPSPAHGAPKATLEAAPATLKLTVAEAPARTAADVAFDAIEARRRRDPEVPTVEHEGQSHTLH